VPPFERSDEGLVYVFSEPTSGWQGGAKAQEIAASDGAANDIFGFSVSVGGGVIAAGSPGFPMGASGRTAPRMYLARNG